MAQQNRRRSRKGGSPRRNAKPEEGQPPEEGQSHGLYESGEEALEEAQLAFGRPDLAERPSAEELTAFEEADAGHGAASASAGESAGNGRGGSGGGELVQTGDGDSERGHGAAVAPRREGLFTRVAGFVQGSWRELNRVQWPDRRQVFQATGVVLGFVIVAGAFLGLASFVANKIVNLILYGHG